ncbi:hypothetical protein KKG19_00270 [Patescibacteria group bacterium]|nr:hypothetical protein [Patescibacteria group bacterium]
MNILRSVSRRLGVADQVEIPRQGSAKGEVYAIARAMGWSPAVCEPSSVGGYVVRPGWTYEVINLDDLTKGVEKTVTVIDDVKKKHLQLHCSPELMNSLATHPTLRFSKYAGEDQASSLGLVDQSPR